MVNKKQIKWPHFLSLSVSLVGIVMVLSLHALIDADRRAYKRPRLLFALHFEIESF